MEEPPEIEQWKRISILGSGAFGMVSLWQHTLTNDYIAIKKCKFQTNNNITEHQRRRWENEVAIMKTLDCINIVSFKELPKHLEAVLLKYNPSRLPLLSMEYCKKGNLRHALNQAKNSTGLPESEVRRVLNDITTAVSYLHKFKITHRDIKPENIVLQECDATPGGIIYKLIDLGYAKELSDSIVSFVGTLHYLAPEIMQTEVYNHTVDYWSLGIVVFEVICGVLPFLPQYTPIQRFPYIVKKKPEHICIYQLQSGSVAYSTELLKEHHISTCLQQHIQLWLRQVLQFDATTRGANLPDNANVFDYLLDTLKKRIVTVFSVHTLEFYSYEINESTLIGTLKDWIMRDTKVHRDDQVLLSHRRISAIADDRYVQDIVSDVDLSLYVYKTGAFLNREFKLPKHVTVLFENCGKKYSWRELRPMYAKSLYFLTQELKVITSLITSFHLYNRHINVLIDDLKDSMKAIYKAVGNTLIRVDCYCNLNSNDFNKPTGDEYKASLGQLQKLLKDFESCVSATNKLITKVEVLGKRRRVLEQVLPKISPIINACDMGAHVAKATELIAKGGSDERTTPREMVKIISNALKDKDKLMNNNAFQNYVKAVSVGVKDVGAVRNWMCGFQQRVAQLSKAIDVNQREQYGILLAAAQSNRKTDPDLKHYAHLDAEFVIKENQELRCDLEDAFGLMFHAMKLLLAETQSSHNFQ